ncbi:hypothetical protein GCM10007916_28800 [Psychromonas marina]|uniref:Uncharacterized protein n=1 Tax=Psychromonas marina TaxID=88364 RepID=A0ABQ6E3B6_9GAMM|nr:hypothetical protein GCM10007916_28800 [Psychromonas marina]
MSNTIIRVTKEQFTSEVGKWNQAGYDNVVRICWNDRFTFDLFVNKYKDFSIEYMLDHSCLS